MWAEVVYAAVACGLIMGLAWFANGNYLPPGLAAQYAQECPEPDPEELWTDVLADA